MSRVTSDGTWECVKRFNAACAFVGYVGIILGLIGGLAVAFCSYLEHIPASATAVLALVAFAAIIWLWYGLKQVWRKPTQLITDLALPVNAPSHTRAQGTFNPDAASMLGPPQNTCPEAKDSVRVAFDSVAASGLGRSQAQVDRQFFIGRWEAGVDIASRETFTIELRDDGIAIRTPLPSGQIASGKWSFKENAANIEWPDNWKDVLIRSIHVSLSRSHISAASTKTVQQPKNSASPSVVVLPTLFPIHFVFFGQTVPLPQIGLP